MNILRSFYLSGLIISIIAVTTEIIISQFFHIIGIGLVAAVALSLFLKKDLEDLEKRMV